MRLLKLLMVVTLFTIMACETEEKNTAASVDEQAEKFKYWAWMTARADMSDSAYSSNFQKLKAHGLDAILINTGTDPELLRRITPLATDAGLEVHAWMFTTNRPGDTVALQHPEWYMVSRSGKSCFNADERPYVGYYQWLSPSHPEARAHILSLVEGLVKVEGVTSVHLDYIRYPDVFLPIGLLPKYNLVQEEELPDFDFDYSDAAVNKFKALHHKDPRLMDNPAIDMEWKNFRLNEIRTLVNEAYDLVHGYDKQLSAAVFPYPEMADHMVRQRWDKWKIDDVLPMIYHNFYNEELDWIGYATAQGIQDLEAKDVRLHTGLFVPELSAAQLDTAIAEAKANGAGGVAFFSANSLTDEKLKVVKASKEN
ncbi:family 10 glycosylhydrolase [Marinoscillum furvescens]|uniref:Glycosyl hydrolase family 10 n=1 Tax=Marinoscillum furvescens DSM 4134 TaxID=1122208 RepID=A0A3D9LFX1_MARFU|nr:family 10 glycosylhydrolase [Marinoscillum furvescens]REE05497.1 glycosyl hydrolase family 10 [Marinoscillum furvescens DSM 4134]